MAFTLSPLKNIKSGFSPIRFHREPARIKLRLAKPDDLSELARLRWEHAESARPGTSQLNADFCESFREFMLAPLANQEWLILVAETNERLVGCVYLQKSVRLPRPDKIRREFGCITGLFIQNDYRGKGLRTELLRGIAEVAQAEGLEYIVAQPTDRNRSVFRLLGFRDSDPEMALGLK